VTEPTGTRHRVKGRAVTVAVLALVMGNLLWLTGNAWFLLLAGAVVGALVVAVASRGRLDGLAVELAHPARVAVGAPLHTVLTVTNSGTRTSSEATLCLQTAGIADLTASVGRLQPGERIGVPVTRLANGRAIASVTLVHLVSQPSLGLTGTTRSLDVPDHVTVHPRLHDVPARPVGRQVGDGTGELLVSGQGGDVVGVRDWRPGDDRRRIHWRSTARTGRPTLVERGDPYTEQLRVVLVGTTDYSGFEDAVSAAASACDLAVRAGRAVTAVAWRADGPVRAPTGSRWELLDWWSGLADTVFPDPAFIGAATPGGLDSGAWLVAGPVEVLDQWLAPARHAGPGIVLFPIGAAS
jgi:uncharacterized protein (DUF58 family)